VTLEYRIRKYEQKDRQAVRKICVDTGILGNPIDPVFSDRELFADMATGYYLDYEPESAFVAELEDEVVGYLTASISKWAYLGIVLNGIPPAFTALYRLFRRQYVGQPQNKDFLQWVFTKSIFEIPSHPGNAMHFHFNLKKGHRKKGIGSRLVRTAIQTLKPEMEKRNITLRYCEVITHSKKSEHYYLNAGFAIFDKKQFTSFNSQVQGNVYHICITKSL